MQVRCVTTLRVDATFAKLGLEPKRGMVGNFSGHVTAGEEYLVYGIRMEAPAEVWKEGPRVLDRSRSSRMVPSPVKASSSSRISCSVSGSGSWLVHPPRERQTGREIGLTFGVG